jgi:cleavage and polyadenylation specificity factor subunit 1
VFLRCGQLAIYALLRSEGPIDLTEHVRPAYLCVKFVKVASKAFEIQRLEETEKTVLAQHKRISHQLIPFVTSPSLGVTFSGVFFTGDRPSWILATDKNGIRIHPSGHTVVHSFTTCSFWESKGDFLVYSDEVCINLHRELRC